MVQGFVQSFLLSPSRARQIHRAIFILSVMFAQAAWAQSIPYKREFAESKTVLEKHLKELQSSTAGQLPLLAGFTIPADRPLEHFQRGYYQCTAQVAATPSGGSIVTVKAVITAWYADPLSAKSGYQVLPSNGRIEADFLDRLQASLGHASSAGGVAPAGLPSAPGPSSRPGKGALSPTPPANAVSQPKGSAVSQFKLSNPMKLEEMPSLATRKAVVDRSNAEQEKQRQGLEEILRNQVYPGNLAAVKQSGTPVLASPAADARILFLATAEDEFEILDKNANWVHVRVSGLSRGWIRRSKLELLTASPEVPSQNEKSPRETSVPATQPFQIENEQAASFPGNWQPLQGKTVRIVSVQKAASSTAASGGAAKLAFAKSLLDQQYADLAKAPGGVDGVVVIFDSEDGGLMAATMPALRQWKSGVLSDQAFLARCFFDPPEVFGLAAKP
jgi:hypothetical protein